MATVSYNFSNDRYDIVIEQAMELYNGELRVTLKFKEDFDGVYAAGVVVPGTPGSSAGDAFNEDHYSFTMIRGEKGDQLSVVVHFEPFPDDCNVAGGSFASAALIPTRKVEVEVTSCFVATAVYRDSDHPQVQKLRKFRDGYLKGHMAGRLFIRTYYLIGPFLAVVPARSPFARKYIKWVLDRL